MFLKLKRIKLERCICGEMPEVINNLESGKYGMVCPKCGRCASVVCYDEESAIELWNEKKNEWKQEG